MLSIIIPCYNQLDFLRHCLNSFLWQNPTHNFEVILIDNNSDQEDLNQIYLSFYNEMPLYLIKQPKLAHPFSLSRARNIGLKLAKYDWVATLDSDVIINPGYLDAVASMMSSENNFMVTGERIFVSLTQTLKCATTLSYEVIKSLPLMKSSSNYGMQKDRRLAFLKNIDQHPHPWGLMHGGNTIFPKAEALKINGYDEAFDGCWGYEDVDFAYRLLSQKQCVPKYHPQLYCYHLENINAETVKQRFDKKNNANWHRVCNLIPGYQQFKEKEYQHLSEYIQL